jgi:hypothetical protein
MRFDVCTVMKMYIVVSRVVTPCSLVDYYQLLGEAYCPHLEGRNRLNGVINTENHNLNIIM